MEQQIVSIENIKEFVFGGKSTFTVLNTLTEGRVTFKVSTPKDDFGKCWFVSVLSGPDNENSYTYVGLINMNKNIFRLTQGSKVNAESKAYKAFRWLFQHIQLDTQLPETVNFYHAGRCGRCGRKLTTPESVERGFGPHCAEVV